MMHISHHQTFAADEVTTTHFTRDLHRIREALSTIHVDTSKGKLAPEAKRDLGATLETAICGGHDIDPNSSRLGIPYHIEFTNVRSTSIDIGPVRDRTAHLLALGTYQQNLFTATLGWVIAKTLNRIDRGIIVAPTAKFASAIGAPTSPYARYIAILDMAQRADALRVPTLLIGITPYPDDPEIA